MQRLATTVACDQIHGICGIHRETFLEIQLQQMDRLMDCYVERILQRNSDGSVFAGIGKFDTRVEEVDRDTIPTPRFSRKS